MTLKVHTENARDVPPNLWMEMDKLRLQDERFRSPFFTSEFAQTVAGVREDLAVHIGEDEQGLAFYWPMHVSRGGMARGLGGPFSDRNGPVVRPGFELDVMNLLQSRKVCRFNTAGYVSETLEEFGGFRLAQNNETHLNGDFDGFLDKQRAAHPAHFKRLYRLKRKLEKEHSEVVFCFDDLRPDVFATLITMKREQYRWSKRHDVLGPIWVQNMFDRLQNLEGDGLRVRLSSLCVDGKLAAGELNLEHGRTLHGWITAYDETFYKYSPGNLVTQLILEDMPSYGLDYYDSGIGGDHYKKYISNVRSTLGVGTLLAPTSGFNIGNFASSTWRRAEQGAPVPVSNFLGRVRRRSNQIHSTEIEFLPTLKGYFSALNVKT